jgi:phosphatidylglycerophosphate synthase
MKGPWTLPNFITLLRLAILPFFLYSISIGRFDVALALFVGAGISPISFWRFLLFRRASRCLCGSR